MVMTTHRWVQEEEKGSSEGVGSGIDVGVRIEYQGDRGTVRYIGTVQGRGESVWVGVEWDRAGRGKHDGTVEGVKYFECEMGRGSLVKGRRIGDGGRRSVMQAVRKRYLGDVREEQFRGQVTTIGGGVVDIVSRRDARMCELEVVDVSSYGVCRVGSGVSELVGVRDLCVAKGLFGWMGEVCEIVEEVGQLRRLDASHNVLQHGRRAATAGGGLLLEESYNFV